MAWSRRSSGRACNAPTTSATDACACRLKPTRSSAAQSNRPSRCAARRSGWSCRPRRCPSASVPGALAANMRSSRNDASEGWPLAVACSRVSASASDAIPIDLRAVASTSGAMNGAAAWADGGTRASGCPAGAALAGGGPNIASTASRKPASLPMPSSVCGVSASPRAACATGCNACMARFAWRAMASACASPIGCPDTGGARRSLPLVSGNVGPPEVLLACSASTPSAVRADDAGQRERGEVSGAASGSAAGWGPGSAAS